MPYDRIVPMSTDRTPANFTMSFSEWMRILMAPMVAGPRHCHVTLSADRLDVRMGMGGWAFAASIHRSSIVDVRKVDRRVWGWGAHGWGGRWLVNGSSEGLVQLTIDPPEHGRCMVFAVKLKQLTLSLDDPDGFVAALNHS
jgi:hypothetical protein